MDCYIYYKANVENARQIQVCVKRLQQYVGDNLWASSDFAMAAPQLQRRPEASDGVHTWMEVYKDVPAQFERIARDAAIASGILEHIVGERRLEYFIDVKD
ncbi:DUF4936 family protein [Undibacterium sp.]|uniref:DUF4936 family protein n=1 Tax=Undibacterium sp. TaxID=1914977 RepID=UPI003752D0B0